MRSISLSAFLALALLVSNAFPTAAAASERLVVLGQQITEIVVALGEAQRIVAADAYLDHIEGIEHTARIPGYRQRAAEPLLVYRPDRVLILDDNQFPSLLQQLRALGIEVVLIDPARRAEDVPRLITAVGAALGEASGARALADEWRRQFAAARAERLPADRPAAVFVLAGGQRPTLVAGAGTTPGQLIDLAGGRNIGARVEGFQVMGAESLIAAAPALVITNPDGLTLQRGVPVALSLPGLAESPAARDGHVKAVREYFLNGFGLHTPQAIREIRTLVEAVSAEAR